MSNAPNTTTTSNLLQDSVPADGHEFGASSAALIGFYGASPIAQPSASAQAIVVDASGGAAAPTNGILTLTGSYNSAIIANAIATLAAQSNAIRLSLVNLGLIKGS